MKKIAVGLVVFLSIWLNNCMSFDNDIKAELLSRDYPIAIKPLKFSKEDRNGKTRITIAYQNISEHEIEDVIFIIRDNYFQEESLSSLRDTLRSNKYNSATWTIDWSYDTVSAISIIGLEIIYTNGNKRVFNKTQTDHMIVDDKNHSNTPVMQQSLEKDEYKEIDLDTLQNFDWVLDSDFAALASDLALNNINEVSFESNVFLKVSAYSDQNNGTILMYNKHRTEIEASISENIERRFNPDREYKVKYKVKINTSTPYSYHIQSIHIDSIDGLISIEELAVLDAQQVQERKIAEERRMAEEAEAAEQQAKKQALEEENLQNKLAQAKGYKSLSWGSNEQAVEASYSELEDITASLETPKQVRVLRFQQTDDIPAEIRFYFVDDRLYMAREYYGLINNETLIRVIAASFVVDYGKRTDIFEFGTLVQYSYKSDPITHALLTLNFISRNNCRIDAVIYNPDLLDIAERYNERE